MGISQTIEEARRRAAAIPRARTAGGGPVSASPGAASEGGRRPAPAPGRLAGLCGWAALLGFLGIVVGARGLIAILVKAPSWYEPTLITLGLSGIGLTVLAFLTVHQRYVPWFFLTLASGVLVASLVATGDAT